MTIVEQSELPPAWQPIFERHAPAVARELLADAWRYLAAGSSERVPPGRAAETLKNLFFAYLEPAEREAVLYDLAAASIARAEAKSIPAAGLVALGGVALSFVLARRRRP